jgi:hypothetical protein
MVILFAGSFEDTTFVADPDIHSPFVVETTEDTLNQKALVGGVKGNRELRGHLMQTISRLVASLHF